MKTATSISLFEKAKTYFPGGVNSPVRAFRSVGGTPLFIEKGEGSHIWDADGNKFIDFCCSWGPLILGHTPPQVYKKVVETMKKGTSFGAPTHLENQLAELILTNNRFIEKIRFVSSGTEAVMSAIRLARGFTQKNKILKFEGCYHGHVDSLLVKAGSGLVTFGNASSAGIPESVANDTIVVPLADKKALQKAFDQFRKYLACVIIEPVPANNGLLIQERSYLEFLREICTAYNVILIFDEVISGFRVSFEGAAGYYNLKPDIITYGKIIGGGFPVGAYGASREIMSTIAPEGSVYQAGTLSGNPVAMSAGIAQLNACLADGFYETLNSKTQQFINLVNTYCNNKKYPVKLVNIGSIFWIAFTEKQHIRKSEEIDPSTMSLFKTFYHELLERGVYLGPSGYEVGFVSAAHGEKELTQATKAFCDAFDVVFKS